MKAPKIFIGKRILTKNKKTRSILVASYSPKLKRVIKRMKNPLNKGVSIDIKYFMRKGYWKT